MTPVLRLLSGFARAVSLSLHVRVTCLHSGSWLLSGFLSEIPNQKFRIGMLMIDVFVKFMHVVPIYCKKEEDLASGMIECLHKVGRKPPTIYNYKRRGSNEQGSNTQAIEG